MTGRVGTGLRRRVPYAGSHGYLDAAVDVQIRVYHLGAARYDGGVASLAAEAGMP